MDLRYCHPDVAALWTPEAIYAQWLEVETCVLNRQRVHGLMPIDETAELLAYLMKCHTDGAEGEIAQIERRTKHDVAAFLEWVRGDRPDGKWIHYGLTSSDVVDTAQGMRFRSLRVPLQIGLSNLVFALTRWVNDDTAILGRTHGQVAEPMTMRARAQHWTETLTSVGLPLMTATTRMAVAKLSGPVGTYAHNSPALENAVAKDLGLRPHGPGASQIACRAPLAVWASSAALLVGACAKIGMDIRLMDLVGDTKPQLADGQIGSSSMPHKINPIGAEQLGGMARMAQGYAAMLQPLDVWLERDISHSSVERVAVPDLWHVLFHSIALTTRLLGNLTLDTGHINQEMRAAGTDPMSCEWTLWGVRRGMGLEQARGLAASTEEADVNQTTPEDAARFMRHYPRGQK